jgi:hypothetical protein
LGSWEQRNNYGTLSITVLMESSTICKVRCPKAVVIS